jgi:hypothetical protein
MMRWVLALASIVLCGCTEIPEKDALVRTAEAAIEIGQRACAINNNVAKVRPQDWQSHYSGGYWIVEAPDPDTVGGWLHVRVWATTGKPDKCERQVPVEMVV